MSLPQGSFGFFGASPLPGFLQYENQLMNSDIYKLTLDEHFCPCIVQLVLLSCICSALVEWYAKTPRKIVTKVAVEVDLNTLGKFVVRRTIPSVSNVLSPLMKGAVIVPRTLTFVIEQQALVACGINPRGFSGRSEGRLNRLVKLITELEGFTDQFHR